MNEYHQQQAALTFGKMLDKVKAKDAELDAILAAVPFSPSAPVRVAVLGCADRRYVPYHQRIFEDHFSGEVNMTTFDITLEHLEGVPGAVQHDCTLPLPGAPYDFVWSHVLLKFISVDQQMAVLKNSYDALRPGGLAVHIVDTEEIQSAAVPLSMWTEQLAKGKIETTEVPLKYGVALVLRKA